MVNYIDQRILGIMGSVAQPSRDIGALIGKEFASGQLTMAQEVPDIPEFMIGDIDSQLNSLNSDNDEEVTIDE